MTRRLDIHAEKKLRGRARHERAFFAAMAALDGWTPAATDRPFENAKLPVFEKAVSQRHGTPTFRRAVVARLLDQAASLAQRTAAQRIPAQRIPAQRIPARVAAIIDWPGLWLSELCVFHDADHAHSFDPAIRSLEPRPARTYWDGGWVEARHPARDLLSDLKLTLPTGFTAHGTEIAEYDRDTDHLSIREEWVVMQSPVAIPSERYLP